MENVVKPHWTVSLESLMKVEEKIVVKKDNAFRPVSMKCGVFEESRGSAYVEMGETKVLVQIEGPRESVNSSQRGRLIVHLDAEGLRIRSELESALSSIVHLDKYPRAEFTVNVSVLSCSGGELAASIIASSLALVHGHIELLDVPVAIHVAFLPKENRYIIDPPCPLPPSSVSVTVAIMPHLNQVICTSIRGALTVQQMKDAMTFATQNSLRLHPVMKKSILAAFS